VPGKSHDRKDWHGVTSAVKADEYHIYRNQTGVPDYQATEGNRGVYVLRRIEDARVHFLRMSLWDSMSMDTIKGFAAQTSRERDTTPRTKSSWLSSSPPSSTTRL
jgi:hypothetical protein